MDKFIVIQIILSSFTAAAVFLEVLQKLIPNGKSNDRTVIERIIRSDNFPRWSTDPWSRRRHDPSE